MSPVGARDGIHFQDYKYLLTKVEGFEGHLADMSISVKKLKLEKVKNEREFALAKDLK